MFQGNGSGSGDISVNLGIFFRITLALLYISPFATLFFPDFTSLLPERMASVVTASFSILTFDPSVIRSPLSTLFFLRSIPLLGKLFPELKFSVVVQHVILSLMVNYSNPQVASSQSSNCSGSLER